MLTEERRDRMRQVARQRQQGCVVLEDIHDPHNAAAVFRSCEAFGIQRVYLIFEQGKPFDPRRIGRKTGANVRKWLDFEVFRSTRECLVHLHDDGHEVVATALATDAEEIYAARLLNPKTALLIGNEHSGLSEEAVAMADRKLIIPMRGMAQSLNLSVTCALCLYELTRQRLEQGIEQFLLPESEQTRLAADFNQRALPKRLRDLPEAAD